MFPITEILNKRGTDLIGKVLSSSKPYLVRLTLLLALVLCLKPASVDAKERSKTMSTLNAQQIASLLQKQGVAKEKIPTMTAIALAESSGRLQAFNPNSQTGDRSYGLFQVNMHGGLGPARMKEFGLKSEKDLFNPETNVKAAKRILESQGLGAWSVYKGGQYKQFLPEAQKALSSLGTAPATPTQAPQQAAQQQLAGGNTYNFHLSGDDVTSRDFLTAYLPKVMEQRSKPETMFDPLSLLTAAFNSGGNYGTY